MTTLSANDARLKDLLKQAVMELLEERRDLFSENVAEAMEEAGLVNAIREGHSPVTRSARRKCSKSWGNSSEDRIPQQFSQRTVQGQGCNCQEAGRDAERDDPLDERDLQNYPKVADGVKRYVKEKRKAAPVENQPTNPPLASPPSVNYWSALLPPTRPRISHSRLLGNGRLERERHHAGGRRA